MNSWARVGMKVVYIANKPHRNDTVAKLEVGGVYVIRAMIEHPVTKEAGVLVQGVKNPTSEYGFEKGYQLVNFRPLVSQEDDISMFKSLLKPIEVPA